MQTPKAIFSQLPLRCAFIKRISVLGVREQKNHLGLPWMPHKYLCSELSEPAESWQGGVSTPAGKRAGGRAESLHGGDLLAHSTHSGLSSVTIPQLTRDCQAGVRLALVRGSGPAVPVSRASHGEQPARLASPGPGSPPALACWPPHYFPYNPGLGLAGLLSS